MASDKANREAEKKIEEARRSAATVLDLSGLGITELPESLGQLTQLESLDLGSNQLTVVPEWLGQLSQLQSLDLGSNQLSALPESLGQLSQLQSLRLSSNQLMELPESLGQLSQLQSLYLSSNQLMELPESLGQLSQLQGLHLSQNPLMTLPAYLSELRQLRILSLGENGMEELPSNLQKLINLKLLFLQDIGLKTIPNWFGQLESLEELLIDGNKISDLPDSFGNLTNLKKITFGQGGGTGNPLRKIPTCIRSLNGLDNLLLMNCEIEFLPDWIGELSELRNLSLQHNHVTDLPVSLGTLKNLKSVYIDDNPLNPELAAAYKEGFDSVVAYLRAKAGAEVILNEAKLILVGEGEVGKSCLLDALRGVPWREHDTTHGIQIEQVPVTDSETSTEITLNCWDFGGQRVYRPTHQLFFSSPAVYLVVWKPREGPQQGFVKEWITLVKHREPDAKILVVATHGGPQQRQPDIDRQELRDLFGKDMVLDFFHVDSKPDEIGNRGGIEELKCAIARVASNLPEMGRSVPKRWRDVREVLKQTEASYLRLERVLELCRDHKMDNEEARLFVTISHRLGHLIHYEHDPALRDIVVLKPDWLAAAISFVLDDKVTREANGLVPFSRLSQLWDDPNRAAEFRYQPDLHPLFLRLMERFDLSYKVALPTEASDAIGFWEQVKEILNKAVGQQDALAHVHYTSLIAQLVPDTRPENDLQREWPPAVTSGDIQQAQICRIVDEKGLSSTAEGLFYQLIVRLDKYSLGQDDYYRSVHWQRGLVLDDNYNGRALLEHIGNDVRITVRAPYPERFLAMLTGEVKYLVESFWEGLRCDVMVPCITPCSRDAPGTGLYEVEKLIDSKRRNRPEYPCPVCNDWQDIDHLLRNAPSAQPVAAATLFAEFAEVQQELVKVRQQLTYQGEKTMGRFDRLDDRTRRILSRVDNAYASLMQAFTDEAKEGPRLFSLVPVDRSKLNPRGWTKAKFRLTLWCEHSRLPLPSLNSKGSRKGVYDIELTREWFKKAGPYLQLLTGTLSLVLPVASSAIKLALDEAAYKAIEDQLVFGKNFIDETIGETAKLGEFMGATDTTALEHGEGIRAQGSTLRELHALLKAKDPSFGGLVRVMNKRQEFLWVHPQFENEY